MRGGYQTSANQTPLQASLAGIDAHRVFGEIDWRASESQCAAALSYEQFNFSDGNRRDIARTHWTERLIAGPVYRLELTGALYASRNSQIGGAYFNPTRDFSPMVEVTNEWLQWRHYTRSFRHRLSFGSRHLQTARLQFRPGLAGALRAAVGSRRPPLPCVTASAPASSRTTASRPGAVFAYLYLTWRF